jgi:hypothetical protein
MDGRGGSYGGTYGWGVLTRAGLSLVMVVVWNALSPGTILTGLFVAILLAWTGGTAIEVLVANLPPGPAAPPVPPTSQHDAAAPGIVAWRF